jgi:hypothetical protein
MRVLVATTAERAIYAASILKTQLNVCNGFQIFEQIPHKPKLVACVPVLHEQAVSQWDAFIQGRLTGPSFRDNGVRIFAVLPEYG